MITNVQSVSVTYRGRKVGTLSMGNKHVCQFEYDKDWVAGTNIRITRARCLEIIEEVREGTKELIRKL